MNKTRIAVALVAVGSLVAASGLGPSFDSDPSIGPDDLKAQVQADDFERSMALEALSAPAPDVPLPVSAPCTEGFAGPYTCENIDLASVVPLAELGGVGGADSWGWTSPDGDEIAIMGTDTGTTFVDVTDPNFPVVLGQVVTESKDSSIWRDVKVINDHAVIVSEDSGHGMQVFDLTRLADEGGVSAATTFEPDAVYSEFSSAHNIAVNDDSDFAYAVGTDTCNGGLHMIDMSNPKAPTPAGCAAARGYTHDVQCVNYTGPDRDHYNAGQDGEFGTADDVQHEICVASNERSGKVVVYDVTDKGAPKLLATIGYSTASIAHQGWFTPNQRWFVFNDEGDESGGSVDNTTTYVLDLQDLDLGDVREGDRGEDPLITSYAHGTTSVDHNLYTTDADHPGGKLVWEANYNAGLRVLGYEDGADGIGAADFTEVAYFDVNSEADFNNYGDAWNVYPFFESGTIIVSNLAQGLFVLQPDYEAINAS